MNKLFQVSGLRLAEMIRSREVSSEEVVRAHIDCVKRVNPAINAMVRTRFDEAIAEAREADNAVKDIPSSELPPYHGVPCSIKECFALTGMPNCSGHTVRKDYISTEDATAVSRLRKAGAIPLGVTNTSELCMWMESYNRVYGRTGNPYNPERIVGGSSGGEGAIIGAGAVPFGLGSDIGGSIRMPAFFNGIFGHKPSSCLVPNSGQYPISTGTGQLYLSTGPMTRRAEDLMPLLRILAGPDGISPVVRPMKIGDPGSVSIKGLKVLMVGENGSVAVKEDLRSALAQAGRALADRGADVRTASFPMLKHSLDIWSSMLTSAGGPTYEDRLGSGNGVRLSAEMLKLAFGKSPYTIPSLALVGMERLTKHMKGLVAKWSEAGKALREELTKAIGADGVLLYPPYSRVAPKHRVPILLTFHWQYTAIMNVMEFPVTQVPLGLNAEGLPLGVQVVGIHGNDHLTIAVAMELEKAFGGWVSPAII